MAKPIIRMSGNIHGLSAPGTARSDLFIGETVTLTDTEILNIGASYQWQVFKPIGSSSNLTGSTTATASIVLDVVGSYRFRCLVNGSDQSFTIGAILTENMGLRIPAFGETLEFNEAGNDEGWHTAMSDNLLIIESHDHASQGIPVPTGGININANLSFNDNDIEEVRIVKHNVDVLLAALTNRSYAFVSGDFVIKKSNGTTITISEGTDGLAASLTSLDTRLDTLESFNLDPRLDTLEAFNLDPRLDVIEAIDAGTRLTSLESSRTTFGVKAWAGVNLVNGVNTGSVLQGLSLGTIGAAVQFNLTTPMSSARYVVVGMLHNNNDNFLYVSAISTTSFTIAAQDNSSNAAFNLNTGTVPFSVLVLGLQ
jgi:hypothetical protein